MSADLAAGAIAMAGGVVGLGVGSLVQMAVERRAKKPVVYYSHLTVVFDSGSRVDHQTEVSVQAGADRREILNKLRDEIVRQFNKARPRERQDHPPVVLNWVFEPKEF